MAEIDEGTQLFNELLKQVRSRRTPSPLETIAGGVGQMNITPEQLALQGGGDIAPGESPRFLAAAGNFARGFTQGLQAAQPKQPSIEELALVQKAAPKPTVAKPRNLVQADILAFMTAPNDASKVAALDNILRKQGASDQVIKIALEEYKASTPQKKKQTDENIVNWFNTLNPFGR